jgi:DNA-binding LacI/PurR family transcriptional regulator
MREAGVGLVVEAGDMTEEGGSRASVRLLSRPERPIAIFAANDLSCGGALWAATELGVRVPEQLSLVGFDNSALARLSAVAHERGRGGARDGAAGGADAAGPDRGPRGAKQVRLMPPRLEVRGSSGPAPRTGRA